jgi:hypothetical protein
MEKLKGLSLRCYADYGTNENKPGFYAVCIDLNVFTWRPTLKEAKKSLNDAIYGYLETALDLASEENVSREELFKHILRPSPFWPYQAKYFAFKILGNVKKSARIAAFNKPIDMSILGIAV